MLAEWVAGAGPTVGMTFSPVVTGPLDPTGIAYTKGYRIRLDYTAVTPHITRWNCGSSEWAQTLGNSLTRHSP